jgi:hypothetical protein
MLVGSFDGPWKFMTFWRVIWGRSVLEQITVHMLKPSSLDPLLEFGLLRLGTHMPPVCRGDAIGSLWQGGGASRFQRLRARSQTSSRQLGVQCRQGTTRRRGPWKALDGPIWSVHTDRCFLTVYCIG